MNEYSKVMVPTVSSPSLNIEEKRSESLTGNVRANYHTTFNSVHTIDAFLGFEGNKSSSNMLSGYRGNFPSGLETATHRQTTAPGLKLPV